MSPRRVAVTGLGVLTGYGRGVGALWEGLASGRSAVREHRARFGGRTWLAYPMASLRDDVASLAARLPNPHVLRHERLERDADLIALADCVAQALRDARVAYDPEDNDIALLVTHESPGLADHLQGFFRWGEMARAWLRSPARFNPPEFLYRQKSASVYRLHSFLYLHYLAALFRFHGFSLYNNNACASGAFALAVAAERIRSGVTPLAVVVGGDVPEDGTKYRWFADAGLYSTRGACRPFQIGRDGLVLGSGAAALVLEDLDTARQAGKTIHAEWLGGGFTSEGWKVTMPDVASGRYAAAISAGLRTAAVSTTDVTLVAPHGVGTGMLDHFEADTLATVFGRAGESWPSLMTVKAGVGHTLGGSVLVETVAALLALGRAEIPAAARCDDPDPALPIGRQRELGRGPWTLLKCTNGFAGQNSAIVLRSAGDA
jgi:3-oxoacyl-(acyl-carrier-protein) synthase